MPTGTATQERKRNTRARNRLETHARTHRNTPAGLFSSDGESDETLSREMTRRRIVAGEFDTGDTAWMLMAASLVLLMTPALALFYGGMSRQKSVLNMMMMSFGSMGLVGIIYLLWGWSMSYGGQSDRKSVV